MKTIYCMKNGWIFSDFVDYVFISPNFLHVDAIYSLSAGFSYFSINKTPIDVVWQANY